LAEGLLDLRVVFGQEVADHGHVSADLVRRVGGWERGVEGAVELGGDVAYGLLEIGMLSVEAFAKDRLPLGDALFSIVIAAFEDGALGLDGGLGLVGGRGLDRTVLWEQGEVRPAGLGHDGGEIGDGVGGAGIHLAIADPEEGVHEWGEQDWDVLIGGLVVGEEGVSLAMRSVTGVAGGSAALTCLAAGLGTRRVVGETEGRARTGEAAAARAVGLNERTLSAPS
jgi:hypothetical protein